MSPRIGWVGWSVVMVMVVMSIVVGLAGSLPAQTTESELIPKKDAPAVADRSSPPSESSGSPKDNTPAGLEGFDSMSPFSMGMTILAILIGGLVFLFLEVTIIPGFGLAGVTGILLLIGGLALSFWKLSFHMALGYALGSFFGLLVIILWTLYVFPHTSVGKKFVLQTKPASESQYSAVRDLSSFVGKVGVTLSDLRPSGIARIGDERVDVFSDGEFVPRNTSVKVVKERSGNLIVVPFEPSPTPEEHSG